MEEDNKKTDCVTGDGTTVEYRDYATVEHDGGTTVKYRDGTTVKHGGHLDEDLMRLLYQNNNNAHRVTGDLLNSLLNGTFERRAQRFMNELKEKEKKNFNEALLNLYHKIADLVLCCTNTNLAYPLKFALEDYIVTMTDNTGTSFLIEARDATKDISYTVEISQGNPLDTSVSRKMASNTSPINIQELSDLAKLIGKCTTYMNQRKEWNERN